LAQHQVLLQVKDGEGQIVEHAQTGCIEQNGASASVMAAISDGTDPRKGTASSSKQDAKTRLPEAGKGDKKVKVSLAKEAQKPRLAAEIRRVE
jgi:hypothetical protein